MSLSMYVDTKFVSTKQERHTTRLGWINISRSKYETHAYKENLLYRHALIKKMPLTYVSNINDATFPKTLDMLRNLRKLAI
jgi:hypothetical protein